MNNIKNFINYGLNRDMTAKNLRKMPFGLSIFYLIEIIICLILGGKFLFVGFIVAVTALFAFILCCSNNYDIFAVLVVILTPFAMMGVYFLINLRLIRIGIFDSSKSQKAKYQKIKLYSMLGGIAGISIARILFSGMLQSSMIAIIIVCVMILASIISFGTINFYKLKLLIDLKYDEKF